MELSSCFAELFGRVACYYHVDKSNAHVITIIQQHRYDYVTIRGAAEWALLFVFLRVPYLLITVSFLLSILESGVHVGRYGLCTSFSSSMVGKDFDRTGLDAKIISNLSANNFHNLFGAQNKKHHPGIFLNHSAMPTDDDNNGRTSFVLCPSSFFIIVPFR